MKYFEMYLKNYFDVKENNNEQKSDNKFEWVNLIDNKLDEIMD